MPLARLAAVSLAVIVAAWFALAARQVHELARARTIVSAAGSLSPSQGAHVDSILSAAGTLNPDQDVNLLRGRVALLEHQRPHATEILQELVRREPLNLEGWVWLAQAASADRAVFGRAIKMIRRLDNQGAPAG